MDLVVRVELRSGSNKEEPTKYMMSKKTVKSCVDYYF